MSEPARCPFCESEHVETVGQWGGQIITSQRRCRSCNSYFEAIREEFGAVEPARGFRDLGDGPEIARSV